jgi:hypothetical protein
LSSNNVPRSCIATPQLEGLIQVKASLDLGFYFFSAIALVTICAASEVQVVRLAGPDAVVGAAPDSCHPALTGHGGPVAWQVLLVHNRAALAEMSRVAVDNRFPLCVVDTVKASDVELGVSFTPISGKIDLETLFPALQRRDPERKSRRRRPIC